MSRVLAVLIVGLTTLSVRSAHAQTVTVPGVAGVVTYTAGWNMVAAGLVGPSSGFMATGPLLYYIDGQYQPMSVPAMLSTTAGAWAYLPTKETVTLLAPSYPQPVVTAPLVLGWNLVGDPFDVPATLPPSTTAYWWDSQAGSYQQVTAIPIGGAAWIYAASAGQVPLQAGIPGA